MPFPTARELEIRDESYFPLDQTDTGAVRREIERRLRGPGRDRTVEVAHRLSLLQVAAIGEELRSLGFMVAYDHLDIRIAWSTRAS